MCMSWIIVKYSQNLRKLYCPCHPYSLVQLRITVVTYSPCNITNHHIHTLEVTIFRCLTEWFAIATLPYVLRSVNPLQLWAEVGNMYSERCQCFWKFYCIKNVIYLNTLAWQVKASRIKTRLIFSILATYPLPTKTQHCHITHRYFSYMACWHLLINFLVVLLLLKIPVLPLSIWQTIQTSVWMFKLNIISSKAFLDHAYNLDNP